MNATRPLEYICLYQIEVPTKEGDGYVSVAVDAFSTFLFMQNIEKERTNLTVLKQTKLLLQDPNFLNALEQQKTFCLVYHKFKDLTTQINELINPLGGSMIINDAYVSQIVTPSIKYIYDTLFAKQ